MPDKDGYPLDDELQKIKTWVIDSHKTYHDLMRYIHSIWTYPDYFKRDYHHPNAYRLVTGGWSGNEDIIRAMNQNPYLNAFYWYRSERGGLHLYRS